MVPWQLCNIRIQLKTISIILLALTSIYTYKFEEMHLNKIGVFFLIKDRLIVDINMTQKRGHTHNTRHARTASKKTFKNRVFYLRMEKLKYLWERLKLPILYGVRRGIVGVSTAMVFGLLLSPSSFWFLSSLFVLMETDFLSWGLSGYARMSKWVNIHG